MKMLNLIEYLASKGINPSYFPGIKIKAQSKYQPHYGKQAAARNLRKMQS
jgi:hypothetical protein